jgi:hypothetical protein
MRALMEFWVNIWFLSIVFLVQNFAIREWSAALVDWWLLVLLLPVPFLAAWRATLAAGQWGELVKSAFDVFLPALADKLGYARPSTIARERELWRAFSRAIVFRDPESLADMDSFRTPVQTRPNVLSSEDVAADQD